MEHWAQESVFYHIYPLGFCGAPRQNDFKSTPVDRLQKISAWAEHVQDLGANALYLGPVFESSTHGYDTADYFYVDRRLGDNDALARLTTELHARGFRVIVDCVFNHVGRDFWAFRDLREKREQSAFAGWFQDLRFGRSNPYGDPFSYATWHGHHDLVKLNLEHPQVRDHLFEAAAFWIRNFDIDGLRLDAADCMDLCFLKDLRRWCRSLKPDFWLLGEVVHGDYRRWVNTETLDSVTNYECYKALYSSHNDRNYFEIGHCLSRQFGERGLYRHLPLYAFADNHDVDRVASRLRNPAHLYPLYCLLFTLPGVPSLYYGSEWGIQGRKNPGDDHPLRPQLELGSADGDGRNLENAVRRLIGIRRQSEALRVGEYRQLEIGPEQLAFARWAGSETVIVAVNAAGEQAHLQLKIREWEGSRWDDLLNPGESFEALNGRLDLELHPRWARILRKK